MSHTANTNSNNPLINDRCITCSCSFGIQMERIPCKCINVKCGRQFCAQCVNQIRIYNGKSRSFQCMYCLQVYPNDSLPEKNQFLIRKLWKESILKYDIKRTQDLLINECIYTDLSFDIDCRQRHLMNLISLYKRFCDRTQYLLTAEYIVNQLTDIIRYIKEKENDNLDECKNLYQRLISKTIDDNNIGLIYISLCERLQVDIFEAEYCSMFSKIHAKLIEWSHQQGAANEFQPKLLDLFQILEQDLINQGSNLYLTVRTKIGVIGYASTGKSSLINRLLGVHSLAEDGAAPVSIEKGTYFPLHFDRKSPLISPDDQMKKTVVTFVDIQSDDKEKHAVDSQVKEYNYINDIHNADCDIYILVYDQEFRDEQHMWILYIEEILKRKCVLVRSKVDIPYLTKFQELSGASFFESEGKQRNQFESTIIEQLRLNNSFHSRSVYLVACDYSAKSDDAVLLLKEQSFDFLELLNELGRLVFDACSSRLHALASRTIARAINTIFRRSYVLNIVKYKVAAGFASILPFGDQLPRYLSRDSIRDAFGIDNTFHQYLTQFHLIIYNYKLQTSVFKDCVEIRELQINSKVDTKWAGRAAGATTALSGAARVAFTVGISVFTSAGGSAWSVVDSGKHIFSYINRVCDDTIMVTNSLITSIIEREREKVLNNNHSNTNDLLNK